MAIFTSNRLILVFYLAKYGVLGLYYCINVFYKLKKLVFKIGYESNYCFSYISNKIIYRNIKSIIRNWAKKCPIRGATVGYMQNYDMC